MRAALMSVILAAGMMGGCTSSPPLGPPEIGGVQSLSSGDEIVLPFDDYFLSASDQRLFTAAARELATKCARDFGVVSTDRSEIGAVPLDNSRRYGIHDASSVENLGYHPPQTISADSDGQGGKTTSSWNPSPRERLIMLGVDEEGRVPSSLPESSAGRPLPRGGCAGDAWRGLQSGGGFDQDWLQEQSKLTYDAAQEDERVQSLWVQWSACMEKDGYAYGDPWEANNDDWYRSEPTRIELKTATRDVKCRQQTRLTETWWAIERAYQERQIDLYRDRFDAISESIRKARALIRDT